MVDIAPQYVTLDRLFHSRLFRIPQYQRTYSWSGNQRRDLFDDIKRVREHGDDRSHFMATVVGLRREKQTIVTTEHQIVEIVDGQQRITTLVILLNAIRIAADEHNTIEARVKQEIHDLLIKDDHATLFLLQTNHDTSDYFANYIRTGEHPSSDKAQTIADREILSAMTECEQFVHEWRNQGQSLVDLVGLLKNRLTFIVHEINDESLVYTVFEVLNSRGLEVTWFDRLKSMLMSIIFESNTGNKLELIDEIHQLWTDIYRCVGLRLGLSTESLRFAATLHNPDRLSRPLGERDAALLLRAQSIAGPAQVIATTRWIKDVTEAVDKLHGNRRINAVTNIAQARMAATAIYLRKDLTDRQRSSILAEWEKVTFRIYGIFAKDARWFVGDYVRLAWDIVNGDLTAQDIVDRISTIGSGFSIEEGLKLLQDADCYSNWTEELRYLLRRYEEHLAQETGHQLNDVEWQKIWISNVSSSIEHIKPQSFYGLEGYRQRWGNVHRLGNLTLLPPGLNSELQDKDPADKANAYETVGLLIARSAAILMKPWTYQKVRQREKDMLEWVKQEWG